MKLVEFLAALAGVELAVVIILLLSCLRLKNKIKGLEAKIAGPPPAEPKPTPRRVEVTLKNGKSTIVTGTTFHWPRGGVLNILDGDGKNVGTFGPGWAAAIVLDDVDISQPAEIKGNFTLDAEIPRATDPVQE